MSALPSYVDTRPLPDLCTHRTRADLRPDGFIQPTQAEVDATRQAVAELKWRRVVESANAPHVAPRNGRTPEVQP